MCVVKLWCDQYYPTVKLMVQLCTGHDCKIMSPEILSRDDSDRVASSQSDVPRRSRVALFLGFPFPPSMFLIGKKTSIFAYLPDNRIVGRPRNEARSTVLPNWTGHSLLPFPIHYYHEEG